MKTITTFIVLAISQFCSLAQIGFTMGDPAFVKAPRYGVTARGYSQHSAGLISFASDAQVNSGVGGRTFAATDLVGERFRFGGPVRAANFSLTGDSAVSNNFRAFRPPSPFQYVGQSEKFGGNNSVTFSSPFTVQEGDVLSLFLGNVGGSTLNVKSTAGTPGIRFSEGDITTTTAFSSSINSFSLCIEAFAEDPVFVFGGDSIMAGHNVGAYWYPWADGGPSGTIASSIPYQFLGLMQRSNYYNNCASGGYTWASVVSITLPLITTNAAAWIFHCGVNDVNTGRSWADVESNLNTIKAAIPANCRLYIDEILPWTNGNDTQAATVRAWNLNYAQWCAANNATLILCHDLMGQVRPSTGQLDDLKTAYNQDGVHITQAGVNEMARIIYQWLARDFGI